MAIAASARASLTRRQLLVRSASTLALAGMGGLAKPYLSRAADRPQIACGLQSGDVSIDSAVVWARADRPARMQVECSAVESFKTIIHSRSVDAPGELDNTFGPAVAFQKGCSAEQGENLAPCFGLQFFGRVDIDGQSEVLTVTLKDVDNRSLWSVDIEPRPDARPGRILSQHS